jgi:hypothetical protein
MFPIFEEENRPFSKRGINPKAIGVRDAKKRRVVILYFHYSFFCF